MLLGLSGALPDLVGTKFSSAKASRALIFSDTKLTVVRTSAGIPFQLRYCPSLGKKPEPRKDGPPKKKFDVFDKPQSELLITDLPTTDPSHFLVLNKYPVISNHFIIATKENKSQTHVLEERDLQATYACLKAWNESSPGKRERLFAFFNSGEHSGASQPHRHLQFLPVASMRGGEQSEGWHLLIDTMLSSDGKDQFSKLSQHPDLPFTNFACSFPTEPSSSQLLQSYNDLYQLAKDAVDTYIAANPGQLALHPTTGGDLPISYNLAMTTSGMAIVPRRSEGQMLHRDDGSEVGYVQLNGTVLGGTLMVKLQEEWDLLRAQPDKLDKILESIGIARSDQPTKL